MSSNAPTDPVHFFDLSPDQLTEYFERHQMPAYRTKQFLSWVYERHVIDPQAMTNFSKRDRQTLSDHFILTQGQVTAHQIASDATQKLLVEYPYPSSPAPDQDRLLTELPTKTHATECVMIPSTNPTGQRRRTACISSQVGCPVGCRFCASGLGGLETNLTTGQIVEQVWHLNEALRQTDQSKISNIVFMGMGEPLANFEPVTRAIQTLAAPWGFNLSARQITLSTVGLPAQMRRLADQLDLPITLAISLHAPNNALRASLIPWASHTSIEALIEAGQYYFQKTRREITLEYILLSEVNDQPQHAHELVAITKRLRCNVNLIRYNPVATLPFDRPENQAVYRFQNILKQAGVNAHIRASRGQDVSAACGQLRHEKTTSSP